VSGEKSRDGGRAYRMDKRAQDVAATRQEIVEAAVRLHGSLGPAATTVSAVAQEAGVTRLTVYQPGSRSGTRGTGSGSHSRTCTGSTPRASRC
jgi:hypothetical protein